MVDDTELRALVKRFISKDARLRVDRMVTGLRADRKRLKWDLSCPKYGTVSHPNELPDVNPPYQHSANWTVFHYKQGEVYNWLDLPLLGDWSGYFNVFCTYKRTHLLDHALWCEYAADPYGPLVPEGVVLEIIDRKRDDHEFLLSEGFHCEMAFFRDPKEVVGIDRQYSAAFIRSFAFPDQEPVKFDTLDAQIQYINGLATKSGPDLKHVSRETSDHSFFLRKLKAQCYAMKEEKGPSAMRTAFEIYKSVAKYLESDAKDETQASA